MKTAMQELRDILENCKMFDITDEQKSIFSSIIYQIDIFLLEKEKKQIINARNHWKEQESNAFDDDFIWTGEEYYNKMYNNK